MADVSYRPIMEDWVWSYSRLESYNNCPYAFFCHYILKEDEEPMFYSSIGSFVHEILRGYLSGEYDEEEMLSRFMIGFGDNVDGFRPPESTVDKYINSVLKFLDGFHGFNLETIAVEKYVLFEINGIKMQGYIDYIGKDKDGKIYIIDHKSRELKPRSNRKKPTAKDAELDEMLKQLYIYAEAVKSEYGEYPSYLCFNCYRNGEFIVEPFLEEKYKEVCDRVSKDVNLVMDEDRFCPSEEFYKCRYLCGYNKDCVYHQSNIRK